MLLTASEARRPSQHLTASLRERDTKGTGSVCGDEGADAAHVLVFFLFLIRLLAVSLERPNAAGSGDTLEHNLSTTTSRWLPKVVPCVMKAAQPSYGSF